MSPRKIVRDPGILSGRWRLEETMTPIADIRREAHLGRAGLKERYATINLTDEEIDAIMAFIFPAIREPSLSLSVERDNLTVNCVCGESTPGSGPEIECPCGRNWRVTAEIERLSDARPYFLPSVDDR
jgi:hypothetical protein